MDVTTSNFASVRTFIEKRVLPNVVYIAYDVEFTGLRYEKFERDQIGFMPYEKYKKLKFVAETYQILQLGLTFVVADPQEKVLKAYPFNFYLFPRNPVGFDRNLGMQLNCVKFNNEHGMDWNKWIGEGINYVKISEMPILQQEEKNSSAQGILNSQTGENQRCAYEFLNACGEFIADPQRAEFEFALNGNQMLFRTIQNLFNCMLKEDKSYTLSLHPTENGCRVKKISEKEKQEYLIKLKDQKFGYGLLFQKIWKAKVPFVGHNCFLDLLYIYQHLVAPLPESYFEFKEALVHSGKSFYDTKYLATGDSQLAEKLSQNTRLEDVVKCLRTSKKVSPLFLDPDFNRYSLDKQALHEAGYDSYLTAWAFQQLMRIVVDVEKHCRNRVNINYSFFIMDLNHFQDQLNANFNYPLDSFQTNYLLRVNISVSEGEDPRFKRQECIKNIRNRLPKQDEGKHYVFYEGYREVYVLVKLKKLIKNVMSVVTDGTIKRSDIGSIISHYEWQKERVIREDRKSAEKTHGEKGNFLRKAPANRHQPSTKMRDESEESSSSAGERNPNKNFEWKKQK